MIQVHASFAHLRFLVSVRERLQSFMSVHKPAQLSKRNIPAPVFQLGEEVEWFFLSDDTIDTERYGKTFKETGYIIGMVWSPGHFSIDGWIYTIRYTASELHPPSEGDDVELHESELIGKKWGIFYK